MDGWTFETLLAHVERILAERHLLYTQRFDSQEEAGTKALVAQERLSDAAFAAASQAVAKAEAAQEKRNESQNEFRAQLKDQAGTFATSKEVDIEFKGIREKMDALENWRSKATGAAVVLGLFAGVLGAAVVKVLGG